MNLNDAYLVSQITAAVLVAPTLYPIRKHLISMVAMPGTRHVWDSWAREGLPAAFVVYVDRLGSSAEATYSLKNALGGLASRSAQHEEAER